MVEGVTPRVNFKILRSARMRKGKFALRVQEGRYNSLSFGKGGTAGLFGSPGSRLVDLNDVYS